MKPLSIQAVFIAALLTASLSEAYAAELSLADRHVARGLQCDACHKTMPPKKDVKAAACEGCHGNMVKMAAVTADDDINPHDSHLPAQCFDCHKGHQKPQLVCDQCHEFDGIKVP